MRSLHTHTHTQGEEERRTDGEREKKVRKTIEEQKDE